ncbi:CpeU protein (plasmid) [Thalassoporum mexicanum PCC 7367]|uniref:phycobiliprotein lyase n=1 Tax=Thalassoporum mexicanum TaxID=3457544 RepID=UPI00029FBBE9|nr:phycobiliprotein lyase [Pseudanabaena sp. PCC 7367]AFY72154.1 CpeU protein [Pseudanabaena sp. PCC 7367]
MAIAQPTTMIEFFNKSAGIWFTQRTVHHFDTVADESGESKLYVNPVAADDQRVIEICQSQGIDESSATGGAAFMWQEHKEDVGDPDPDKAAVLVDVPDDETGKSGKLLRNQGYVERIPVVSRYWFGQDGILTIDTEYDHNQGQERAWFITNDFRVRVSTVRMQNGVYLMTYCSERRYLAEPDLEAMVQANLERAAIA